LEDRARNSNPSATAYSSTPRSPVTDPADWGVYAIRAFASGLNVLLAAEAKAGMQVKAIARKG